VEFVEYLDGQLENIDFRSISHISNFLAIPFNILKKAGDETGCTK